MGAAVVSSFAERTAARLARSAPSARLERVASVAGVKPRKLAKLLIALPPRGGCAETLAAAERRPETLQHPMCPPGALRAVTDACPPQDKLAAAACSSTTVWTVRHTQDPASAPHTQRSKGAKHPAAKGSGMSYPVTGVGVPAAMWALSWSDDWLAAKTVAENIRCPGDLLESLVYSPHPQALAGIVENPACPEELMLRLTETGTAQRRSSPIDDDPVDDGHPRRHVGHLRTAAVSNTGCGPRLLQMMSTQMHPHLRGLAAAHPACPPQTRAVLSKDSDRGVSEAAAAAGTAIPRRILRRMTPNPRKQSLVSRVMPKRSGARLESYWNVIALARNPASPPEILDQIVRDIDLDSKVGRAVAANPVCEAKTRGLFAVSPRSDVKLIAEAGSEDTTPRRVARLTAHPDTHVAAVAANNPACPQHTLDRLARHPQWLIRAAAIFNPNASPRIRSLATSDTHPGVRRLAAPTV